MKANKYVYSPTENAFYPVEMHDVYESAGSWPDDTVDVKDSVYAEFGAKTPPEGKQRVAGKNGRPVWVAAPAPDAEMLVAIAESERKRLMASTSERIEWLTAALEDGDISEAESAELEAQRAYRTALRRLDLTAPKIKWPEVPRSVA
ncbi:tail fiber assembly protein [Cedecea davisae]|uniref:tail fiber assembly protein n=1 Tax=Cedecea davisae TaxID=158484 RepID=UPI00242E2C94|nr:tail fiber assembly protein [Cedecea davisae]